MSAALPIDPHTTTLTLAAAAAAGAFLVTLADHLRMPSIALLLVGGVLLGPQFLGIVDPAALGHGLETVIGLAVAIILFEGGLTLDVSGFRRAPTVIVRLLTVGVAMTWFGTALALYLLFDLPMDLALMAGSLVVVTGPTVVSPILRRIRVRERVHHILYWEGVLIDAVGVFLAVLCFEYMGAKTVDEGSLMPLGRFALRFIVGASIGIVSGAALAGAIRRDWVGADHLNIFTLATALLIYAGSNAVLHESGVLAVIAAGLVIALQKPAQLKRIKRFKLELTELGIGVLFILLSAKLELEQFTVYGWRLPAAVAVVVVLLRPLVIGTVTVGQRLSLGEKVFLSWMAPRGIVAAAMASLFALRLEAQGTANASLLSTFTFAIIGTTVIGLGLTAPVVARLLRLERPDRRKWLLAGEPLLVTDLHHSLRQAGVQVIMHPVSEGDAEADDAAEELLGAAPGRLDSATTQGVSGVLALSRSAEANSTVRKAWQDIGEPPSTYRWAAGDAARRETEGRAFRGTRVWDALPSPDRIVGGLAEGTLVLYTARSGEVSEAARFGADFRPLFWLEHGDALLVPDPAMPGRARGDAVLVLKRPIPGLAGLVRDALVIDDYGGDLKSVLTRLLRLAARHHGEFDQAAHLQSIMEREEQLPTTVGMGIALPHVYDAHTDRSVCYVATVQKGLSEEGPDGIPLQLVALVISPAERAGDHLRALAALAGLAREQAFVDLLVAQPTQERLLSLIRERE